MATYDLTVYNPDAKLTFHTIEASSFANAERRATRMFPGCEIQIRERITQRDALTLVGPAGSRVLQIFGSARSCCGRWVVSLAAGDFFHRVPVGAEQP